MADAFDLDEPSTDVMRGIVPRTLRPEERAAETKARVLVADESESARRALADVLRADGYDVREARDSGDLLDVARVFAPELVVTDKIEVLERLRASGGPRPVVLLTASTLDDVRDRALALGAAAVFSKPFEIDDLRTAILNLAPVKHGRRVLSQPSPAAQVESALTRCIFALRDVAAERAHVLIGASALDALERAIGAACSVTGGQRRAAEVLGAAFARFELQRRHGSIAARAELELATISVLDSTTWRE